MQPLHRIIVIVALTAAVLIGTLGRPKAQQASTPAVTTNLSIVITTGNTFQQAMAALVPPAPRRSLTMQNNNIAGNCWIFVGAGSATVGTSILLLPGGSYTRYFPYVPADVIQATCDTTSNTIYIDVQ